jgi:ATP-dependent exoDNAse (exonuclease V) alpha subunit
MILAPEDAPEWARDRAQLWNQVEAAEVRKDAQLAREMDIALPTELTHEQRRDLIKSFVEEQFVDQGMVADVAIHKGGKPGDTRNHHAHVMLTMREIDQEGFGKKVREWNDWGRLEGWREEWEKAANRDLERAGHESRIDHRKLEAQREEALARGQDERALELTRAPQHHKGVAATNLERRGLESEKLERIRKARPAELAPYLEARKEGQKLLGELRGLQAQREREPEYQRLAEAQRQGEERRRQEEERKAQEERKYELARTDRRLYNALVEGYNQEVSKAVKSHYDEAKKAVMERLKPMVERINYLAAQYKEEGEVRQSLEAETKRLYHRINFLLDPSQAEALKQDLAGIDERRQQYATEHKELWGRRQKELSEENITKEAESITSRQHPELLERGQRLQQILNEWQQHDRAERQKQWEREQKEQDREDGGRGGLPGRGRGGPEIER